MSSKSGHCTSRLKRLRSWARSRGRCRAASACRGSSGRSREVAELPVAVGCAHASTPPTHWGADAHCLRSTHRWSPALGLPAGRRGASLLHARRLCTAQPLLRHPGPLSRRRWRMHRRRRLGLPRPLRGLQLRRHHFRQRPEWTALAVSERMHPVWLAHRRARRGDVRGVSQCAWRARDAGG